MCELRHVQFQVYVTEIKAYTPSEIADVYGVSWKVMNEWLKGHRQTIGKRHGLFYTPKQVATIFEILGIPGKIEEAA
jgi:hypothetical protein